MLATKEIIMSIANALGVGNDFKVDKNLGFNEIIRGYNGYRFSFSCPNNRPYVASRTMAYSYQYIFCFFLDELEESDISQLIKWIERQKELEVIDENKRQAKRLQEFRELIGNLSEGEC